MRTEPRDFMQLASSNWMEATGDVPEPSRPIVTNSLSEWASWRKALGRGSIQPFAHLSLLIHQRPIFRDFAS
jgi:hypothetical protein